MRDFKSLCRRSIFEPLQCKMSHSPRYRYWKALERTQFLSEERLRQIQWRRLREMLRFSWEHNDFYRKRFQKAGLTPDDVRSPEDLRNLNILTKAEIRSSAREMISRGFRIETLQKIKTGGSTGKALELYITEECSELRNACARRHDRWTGWDVGEPIGAVWGNPILPLSFKDRLREQLLGPHIWLDTMNVTDQAVLDFARKWKSVRPTLLYGHAHSLYILAEYIRKLDVSEITPKGILSTSMMLLPHERKAIEETFSLKVFDRYGCEEVGLITSECEKHEGMHMNIEHLYIEVVNKEGAGCEPGQPGRIIVTDLMNKAMPFIRYQVEDVGILSERRCSCGRGLPLMETVVGRVADFLVRRNGSKIAGVSLIENTLTKIPGIDQMQIIQESLDLLCIRIVQGREFTQSSANQMAEYFQTLFGRTTTVKVESVHNLQPEPSGKFRFSICKVPSV